MEKVWKDDFLDSSTVKKGWLLWSFIFLVYTILNLEQA